MTLLFQSIHRDNQIRDIRDNMVLNLAPVLCNQLSNQLAQIFVSEIQKHLLPVVGARLDGIKTQIQVEVAQKLSITDKVIKENISNICKSKVSLPPCKQKLVWYVWVLTLNIAIEYRNCWIFSAMEL